MTPLHQSVESVRLGYAQSTHFASELWSDYFAASASLFAKDEVGNVKDIEGKYPAQFHNEIYGLDCFLPPTQDDE